MLTTEVFQYFNSLKCHQMAIIFEVLHAELNLLWAIALVLSKTKYFIHVCISFRFQKKRNQRISIKRAPQALTVSNKA